MAEQEVITESLSGSPKGYPLSIPSTSLTNVHNTPAHPVAGREYIDAVHLKLFNTDTTRHTVDVILNPPSSGARTPATVKVVVPPEGFAWALQGERFRHDDTSGEATIAVQVGTVDVIKVVGWVARFEQDTAL